MVAISCHNFEFSSWYNTQWTEMVSTLGFYDINELHRPQLLETAGCLVITIEHFS